MTTKLFTDQELMLASRDDMLAFMCEQCGAIFYKTKRYYVSSMQKKIRDHSVSFCNSQCFGKSRIKRVQVECSQCGAKFMRTPGQSRQSKSGRQFCNHSCAATYNNLHKTTGTRRSKLEVHIEEELTRLYHTLEIVYNGKDAIGSELDIYIPSLRLAFELNGIYHYEPIHGQGKLDSIERNDSSKFRDCVSNSISLCVIDTSGQINFTKKSSAKYLSVIRGIVDSELGVVT